MNKLEYKGAVEEDARLNMFMIFVTDIIHINIPAILLSRRPEILRKSYSTIVYILQRFVCIFTVDSFEW